MQSKAAQIVPVEKVHGDIAVYSCYFGKYEPLNLESMGNGEGYDRALITDNLSLEYPGAQVVGGTGEADAVIASRSAKLSPEPYFPNHRWVIYVDNRATLIRDPKEIVAEIEAEYDGDAPAGRYLFSHPGRECGYRELRVLMRRSKVGPEAHEHIKGTMQEAGFPPNKGLYMNTIMIQKMGDPATAELNALWWGFFQTLCQRDQVTLPYAMWLKGYTPRILSSTARDFIEWPIYSFKDRRRFQRANR
ncbi:hypothetical protein [uncultured Sulfitobacter sp.]|mgnify:FL=1|uniref:hypothetical protein n=1 Tax=uncultured Sulfitobacter sp. TaxID=191468 RepID=UPI0030FB9E89